MNKARRKRFYLLANKKSELLDKIKEYDEEMNELRNSSNTDSENKEGKNGKTN